MGNPLKVAYLTGHPAEGQLSAPVIRRLQADKHFQVRVIDVTFDCMPEEEYQPDCVISPCDRAEMMRPTFDWFLENKPIVRVYGGTVGSGTHDDSIRHALDALGHIHLVESREAKTNLLFAGEESWRIHVVGITHWDDVTIDESMCPRKPYDLFLMNPVTISEQETRKQTMRALHLVDHNVTTIYIPPNGDLYSDLISNLIRMPPVDGPRFTRNKFLGLLKNCRRFISNSSATVYEAPVFGVEVCNPTWRNAERTKPPVLQPGGSDRIVQVLKEIDWSDRDKLLRKRFLYAHDRAGD